MKKLFNTAEFSSENTKNATLVERKQVFLNILIALYDLNMSSYNFEQIRFTPNKKSIKNPIEYKVYIKEHLSLVNDKNMDKHFQEILHNCIENLLNYQKEITSYNFATSINSGINAVFPNIRKILDEYNRQPIFNLNSECSKMLDIIMENYGFLNTKSFKISKPIMLYRMESQGCKFYQLTLSQLVKSLNQTFEDYPMLEKLIPNVKNNEELFSFIENCNPIFFRKTQISSYLDYIDNEVKEQNDKDKYFDIIIKKIYKDKPLMSLINTDKGLLTKINNLINNESLFQDLSMKMPGLISFFNDFEFSQNSVDEPTFSKTVYYNHVKVAKELLISHNSSSIARFYIANFIDEFATIMKKHNISIEIYKVTISQSKIAAIFSANNESIIEETYQKYLKYLHKIGKELFLDDIAGIKKLPHSKQESIITKYIQTQMFQFDLDETLPQAPIKHTNHLKF